jgi:hypothetical protein
MPRRAVTIPQHKRPDGEWCRWSGCETIRLDGACPDRCQEHDRE